MYLPREARNSMAFDRAQANYENMLPPEVEEVPEEIQHEKFCDYLGEQWVKDGGDIAMFNRWKGLIPMMIDANCFNEVTHPADHCASYCSCNEWQGSVFSYYADDIAGWIVSYMALYGRLK